MAVVEEVRSFRAPLGEEMLHREHALLSLLPTPSSADGQKEDGKEEGSSDGQADAGDAVTAGGTAPGADHYDVAFTLGRDATPAEREAVAAMEVGGGIKLTLEAAHNISAVFHVPEPRPWLAPTQQRLLAVLAGDGCGSAPDDAVVRAVLLPALLGGRWLELPDAGGSDGSRDAAEALLPVLAARLGKGGQLPAAAARAVYLAHLERRAAIDAQQSSDESGLDDAGKAPEGSRVELARLLLSELASAEWVASGGSADAEHGQPKLSPSGQLQLASAVLAEVRSARAAAGEDTDRPWQGVRVLFSGDASHLSDRDLRDARREYLVLDLALTHIDRGSVLDGMSVVGFSHIFRGLGWRDRLRMTQFAIANWQSTGTR